ncbi:MAG: CARDB domain-containing protein [Thermoplasmata archaeon]
MSDYAGEYVQIRFRFASDSIITAKGWYIDDIKLTQPSARDLAISEVTFDTNFFEVGIPTVISYKIINHGLEPQAGYKVYLTTTARGITKEENITISTPLYHGECILQSFNWTPEYPGITNISLRVQIENDFDIANNYANFTCNVQIPGKILVVDDDNGLGNSGTLPDVEGDMIASLEAGAYTYAYYVVDSWHDGPKYDVLSRYEIVIWLLGRASDHTLTSSDINAISLYLQNGGNLWIIGQDLLSDIGSNSFVRNYLHVDSYTTNVAPCQILTGLDESDISYDLNLSISSNKQFPDMPDALIPTEDAQGVYLSSVQGNYSAVSYSGSYNVVFFAYEFSFINTSAEKALLTERIISNFAKIDAYCSVSYQEVKPGETASFEITVRNLGRETASINLSNSAIANWDIRRSVIGPITILPKESTVVYLNVTPPSNARAYSVGSIYLYGNSEKGKFSLLTTTVVLPIYSISVSSSAPQTALPGAQLDYTIFVTSFANGVSDTVSLTFSGLDAWMPSLNVSQVYLPASQVTSVATANLHLKVPGGITAGEYNLTIYAQSLGDPTQTSSCVVRVIVGSTFGISMNVQMKSITLDPSITNTFRVNLEITNTGNSHDTVTISTIIPQGWSASAFPETIPAGQTRTLLLDIVVPEDVTAGNYNLTIIANSMNSIVNASAKITLTILRPDLVVSSEDITITPTAPKTNEQITVLITVRNVGQGVAKNITVQLFDGNTALGSKSINEIKGSESAEVAITCKLSKPGAREITVRIDAANKVIELEETNNFASKGISVKGVGTTQEGINPILIGVAIAAIIALIIVIVLFRNRLFGKKEECEIRQSYAVEEKEEIETPPQADESQDNNEETEKENEEQNEEEDKEGNEEEKEDSKNEDEEESNEEKKAED